MSNICEVQKEKSIKLSVVLAVFNESGNIAPLIKGVKNVIGKTNELIVVDDASTDNTVREVDTKLAKLIIHKTNQGKGAAMKTGIRLAKGDLILFMDGDGQDDPGEIPKVVKPIMERDADFVIGSRFLDKTTVPEGLTPFNLFGNQVLTFLFNLLFRAKFTDSQSAFKCIKADLLRRINLESTRYEIESELLIKALRQGAKFIEVPVKRYKRRHGKSHLYQVPLGRLKFSLRVLSVFIKGYFLWR